MRNFNVRYFFVSALTALHAAAASAGAAAIDLPLDGSWTIREKLINDGDFFADTFQWTDALPVLVVVSDLYAVDAQFEVCDLNLHRLIEPFSSDWDDVARGGPFKEEPYEPDPDEDLRGGIFSSASFYFGPGTHELRIRGVTLPNRGSFIRRFSHTIFSCVLAAGPYVFPSSSGTSRAVRG